MIHNLEHGHVWISYNPSLVSNADIEALQAYLGDHIDLDVHVISDLRTPLDFAVVDVVATWPGGEQRWRFGGPVPADDVVKVGRLRLDAPDVAGELIIGLRLTAGDVVSTNHATTALEPS